MKKYVLIIITLLSGCFHAWSHQAEPSKTMGRRVGFTENKGQWPENTLMRTQTDLSVLWLERDRFTFVVGKAALDTAQLHPLDRAMIENNDVFHHYMPHKHHAYQMVFADARKEVRIVPQYPLEGYENFYIGNDEKHWATGCKSYGMVEYEGIYEGISLTVKGASKAFKYEFTVAPHADPGQIGLIYKGIEGLKLTDGRLCIGTTIGDILEERPFTYQVIARDTVVVESRYRLDGDTLRFELGRYNPEEELVIDPLIFSTYTGSAADNWGTTAAFDSYKNSYTAGIVFSAGYPTSLGAYDNTYHNNADIGIFKFDSTGSSRLFATYLGGNWADMPHSMFVNPMDELVIFGTTGSDDFPTTENAYDRSFNRGTSISYLCLYNYEAYRTIYYPNGSDIFVSRFSSDGSRLEASTYIGGMQNDGLNYRDAYNSTAASMMLGNDSLYYNYGDGARGEIITDDLGNVYVGSTTMSLNFPTTAHSVQRISQGKQEGVVFKMDYNLSNLLWSTFLGGSDNDAVYSIDVDSDYNLLVCGGTTSSNFPVTSGCYMPGYQGGSVDGFVAKISYAGENLMASTYFGSASYDQCYFVRCAGNNDVFLFGQTKAAGSTMIHNAGYSVPNSGQFIAHLRPNLDTLVWSTVFGTGNGTPNISPTAFGVDICNRVYAAGWGRDFVGYNNIQWNTLGTTNMEITPDAYQVRTDGQDFYLMSLAMDASTLDYATFFGEYHVTASDGGADHVDGGTSRFDKLGTLYQSVCASCGNHDDFPTSEGVWSDENLSSNCNNALFRFNIHQDFAVAEFVQPPIGCAPYTVMFHNTGRGTDFEWDFGDGTTSTERDPVHTYTRAGEYTIRLIANLDGGCTTSDTAERKIMILNNTSRTIEPTLACDGSFIQIGYPPMLGCSYRWISGAVSDSTISNPWVNEDGDYVLYMTSNSGCVETDTFRVRMIQIIDSLIIRQPSCYGYHDGSATVVLNNTASDSVIYIWDGVQSNDSILGNLAADLNTHTVTVSNGRCTKTENFRIQDPVPMAIHKESFQTLCTDSCYGWIHIETYNTDTLMENLCEGVYTLMLRDSNNCEYHDTTDIRVDHQLDNVRVWADDTTIFLGLNTQLHATDVPDATYQWSPAETLESPENATTTATPVDTLTRYDIVVSDNMGCQYEGSVTVHCIEVICGEPNVFIPNAFTPNDDGQNDRLCFRGDYITDFHIAIFTRWGEKVFETHDVNDCWDGKYKDNFCMPGVYTYTCQITCEAGHTGEFKGNITLIR